MSSFVDYAITVLSLCKPRVLSVGRETRPILIFTDGSWDDSTGGIGAVLIDLADNSRQVLGGTVPQQLIGHWKKRAGDQVICQVELFVVLWIRMRFKDLLRERRSIWWIDNAAARHCLIKGVSPRLTMQCLVREFYVMDVEYPTFSWFERVPSSSNIADPPSRGNPGEACELLGIDNWEEIAVPADLMQRVINERLVM